MRAEGSAGDFRECVPWVTHCWGRLMSLMPDAVTAPVAYLTEMSLPYLRTAAELDHVQVADAQHRDAMDAAMYYYGEAADKIARRQSAGAAPRSVPTYERPDISSWPKPDRVGQDLTLLQAERDRLAGNQALKNLDVRARKGDDVPYLMTAGHHAKRLSGAGWRRVPAALEDSKLPRGLHMAYPTVLSYSYDRMKGDDRSCLWDMYVVERVQSPPSRCWRTSPAGGCTASPLSYFIGWSVSYWMT